MNNGEIETEWNLKKMPDAYESKDIPMANRPLKETEKSTGLEIEFKTKELRVDSIRAGEYGVDDLVADTSLIPEWLREVEKERADTEAKLKTAITNFLQTIK